MTLQSRQRGNVIAGELRGNPLDNPAVPLSQAAFLVDVGSESEAGVAVTERSAMQQATVFTCVNVLQQDFSSLPVIVYEEEERGRKPARNTDLHHLVSIEPNPEMGARTFYGMLLASLKLSGNAYARIQRKPGTNQVDSLWPLHPSFVRPKRVDNALVYEVAVNGKVEVVKSADMLHFMDLTLDGMVGLSPIAAAKRTIGTAIAVERYGARWFGRGSRPSGVLVRAAQPVTGTMNQGLQPEKSDSVRSSWERDYGGENQGGTAVLPPGWEWKPIGVPPNEAQFLETQQYTRTMIAALFRLQPHMAGDTSRLSNSNHESAAIEYVKYTLRPLAVIFETELQRKLVPRSGSKAYGYTIEFDFTALERGDFATQMAGIAVGRQWGVITGNEGRQARNMNLVGKEGDTLMVPLNMIPADRIGDYADAVTEPAGDSSNQPPEPKGNGGQNQRMLLGRIAGVFAPLYRDAAGRLTSREKRDSAAVQATFGPVLQGIADEAVRQARQMHRLPADVDLGAEKLIREAVKAIEKRAANWNFETIETDAVEDLQRTVRSITLNIFREAGAQLAEAA